MAEDEALVDDFWGEPGDRPFGLSEKQYRFALGLLDGRSQTEAARLAGYKGTIESLRSQGSRAANSPKVKTAIAMAQARRDSEQSGVMLTDEILQMWTKTARTGSTEIARMRAQENLAKYHEVFQSKRADYSPSVPKAVERMAKDGGLSRAVAVVIGHLWNLSGGNVPGEYADLVFSEEEMRWQGMSPAVYDFLKRNGLENGIPALPKANGTTRGPGGRPVDVAALIARRDARGTGEHAK